MKLSVAGHQCSCGAILNFIGSLMQRGTIANWELCTHPAAMLRNVNIDLSFHGNEDGPCNCPIKPFFSRNINAP